MLCRPQRAPNDRLASEKLRRRRPPWLLDNRYDEVNSSPNDVGHRLTNGREIVSRPRRHRHVVESDDAEVFGDGHSAPPASVNGADCQDIVAAEYSVDAAPFDERLHERSSRGVGEGVGVDFHDRTKPLAEKALTEALEPVLGRCS